jgi:hypothetical protein
MSDVYFTCDDTAEELEHETPEEAISAHMDGFFEYDHATKKSTPPLAEVVTEVAPLTVWEFRRVKVSDEWVRHRARSATERLFEFVDEHFSEDFGDPNGDFDPFPDKATSDAAFAKMVAAIGQVLRDHVDSYTVWRCEKAAERTYTAADVTAIMREDGELSE